MINPRTHAGTRFFMIERITNLCKLILIFKERGNWPLIRRSRKQLFDFILCRGGLNRKPLPAALVYWFDLLRGLDLLVWRLETFGFLFPPNLPEAGKSRLNRLLPLP